MPISLGRVGRLDRLGVEVLEELQAAVAVRRLEHRDPGAVAVEADGRIGPLAAHRVAAEDRETEVGEEGDRGLDVANGDADVLECDAHASSAPRRPAVGNRFSGSFGAVLLRGRRVQAPDPILRASGPRSKVRASMRGTPCRAAHAVGY
jgi:hypothetical protein